MALNHPKSGPNHVNSYQMSAIPFVTSSRANEVTTIAVTRVGFPYVTRFFKVKNTDGSQTLRVGFSENSVKPISGSATTSNNFFELAAGADSGVLELRCKELFFRGGDGDSSFEIIAGLTTIPSTQFPVLTGTMNGSLGLGIG